MMPAGRPALNNAQALDLYGLRPHPQFSTGSVRVFRAPSVLDVIEIHKRLALTNLSYCVGAVVHLLRTKRQARPGWVFTRDPRVAWAFLKLRPLTRAHVAYEVHELFGTRPRDNRSLDSSEQWGVADRTRTLERFVLRQSDRLITLTRACRRLIMEGHQIPGSRVRAIPDGTRQPGEEVAAKPRDRSIFYVGQLYRWKGVETLLRALRLVEKANLTIVGSGEIEHGHDVDRSRLEQLAVDVGVADRVRFCPFVPYREVPRCLARASVAVVPLPDVLMSRYFTSPLKLFDAMAAGTPIVASDLESIREVLRDGQNSVLVTPDSPEALAAGIRRVLDDPTFARTIAATARAEVSQYSWERRAERILEFLSEPN
jgi:glycosyltransferase involved in cell wall biosynthesis